MSQQRKATAFSPGKRAFGTHAVGCAVFDSPCYGATVEETEQDQEEDDIEDFVAFSIKSLELFAILDGGATKTVSGFISVQPVADQCEGTTIERTDVLVAKLRQQTRESVNHTLGSCKEFR